jgi:hypothetical protein
MAHRSEGNGNLDLVQERILKGLNSLCEKKPGQCFSYPAISDEVRDQTKGQVVLTLRELQMSKRPLLDNGFIDDRGIGFVLTDKGKQIAQQGALAA